jgi:hypothetical protein
MALEVINNIPFNFPPSVISEWWQQESFSMKCYSMLEFDISQNKHLLRTIVSEKYQGRDKWNADCMYAHEMKSDMMRDKR